MELRYYLATLGRRKWQILGIALLTVIVTYIATLYLIPIRYKSSVFFTISYRDDQLTEEYKGGNYYANFAAIEFARTVSGWPKDPQLGDEVYGRAKVNMTEDLNLVSQLLGPFSVKRVERANIQISMNSKSLSNAEKLADALLFVMEEKVEKYNDVSATKYKVTNSTKVFEENKSELEDTLPIGILIGLLLGILLAYLYEYFAGTVSTQTEAEELLGIQRTDAIPRRARLADFNFLASFLSTLKSRHTLLAGVSFDPSQLTSKLSLNLADAGQSVIVADADLFKRRLHRFFRTTRQVKLGHTDVRNLQNYDEYIYTTGHERLKVLPAGQGTGFFKEFFEKLSALKRINHLIIHTVLPDNIGAATLMKDLNIFLFVKLGTTKSDDVKKLRTLLQDKPVYLVIVK